MTFVQKLIANAVEKNKLKLIVSLNETFIDNLLKLNIIQINSTQNAKGNSIIRVEFSPHLSQNFTVEMHSRKGQHYLWGVNQNPEFKIPICNFNHYISYQFQYAENELDELQCKALYSLFTTIILELRKLPSINKKENNVILRSL